MQLVLYLLGERGIFLLVVRLALARRKESCSPEVGGRLCTFSLGYMLEASALDTQSSCGAFSAYVISPACSQMLGRLVFSCIQMITGYVGPDRKL